MRLAFAAVLALISVSASAQTGPTRPLPRWHRGVTGNFAPPQTSAARAFLYSGVTTGALVGAGTLLIVTQQTFNEDDLLTTSGQIATVLIAAGVFVGPALGNMSLGAGATVDRGLGISLTGMKVGSALIVAGAGVLLLDLGTGPETHLAVPALALLGGGLGVAAGGFVVAAVYNLATIPANARWAQRARANGNRVPAGAPRVSVTPGVDLRHEAPMLTLRVGL